MNQIRLLFGIVFLFAYQLSFSATKGVVENDFLLSCGTENNEQFEKNYFIQTIPGELSKGQLESIDFLGDIICCLPNDHTNAIQVLSIQGNLIKQSNRQELLFNWGNGNRIVNVPIYLQTEKFLL